MLGWALLGFSGALAVLSVNSETRIAPEAFPMIGRLRESGDDGNAVKDEAMTAATLDLGLEGRVVPAGPAQRDGSFYRKSDGVRIAHDPFAAGMAERYGRPGQTDSEGFDPYRDSVGPGIYGGIVKRHVYYLDDAAMDVDAPTALGFSVVIGKQYQDHNPNPGPVYAGGGYAPVVEAVQRYHEWLSFSFGIPPRSSLEELLAKHPDLVNDVTTGGAQPLHMCG
jgi:hypothetical protein